MLSGFYFLFRCLALSKVKNANEVSVLIHPYLTTMFLSFSRSSWVVLIDKTMVSLGQLGDSFDEHGRVEAYVINVFCRILFRDDHPRHSKKHYFFSTVSVSTNTFF